MSAPTLGCALPQFVKDLLSSPPSAGGGVHNWLFRMARVLHPFRTEAEIRALLSAAVSDCKRVVSQCEIDNAIQNSRALAWSPDNPASTPKTPAWPNVNQERREAIFREGRGLVDLWEASPYRFEDQQSNTEQLIDLLFPGDPLLTCGKSATVFDTRSRSEWRGQLSTMALIVPSPAIARRGKTKDKEKESAHCLEIVGERHFLVIEQDTGTVDQQATVLLHLASMAPLALAVHSGGKSIHGWFRCAKQSEERMNKFMRYAVSLGADPVTWIKSQFVRMPDGLRDNGKRQSVYFLNLEGFE